MKDFHQFGLGEAPLMVAPEWLRFTVSLYELVAWKVNTEPTTIGMGYDAINEHQLDGYVYNYLNIYMYIYL